jgi:hypothetical protein
MQDFNRRRFLRGLGGATISLPMLDVFRAHEAGAQATKKIYSVFMMQANGVAQASQSEPEQFWPRTPGALSDAVMGGADADRATSELRAYASKLLMVKGIKFNFNPNGCGHSGGCNQALTAAKVSSSPSGNKSLSMGESLDNRIARELTPGVEPFAVYAGRKDYIGDAISYRAPLQLRAADNNPWTAYQRLVGLGGTTGGTTAEVQRLISRRNSINDVLRGQINQLRGRTDLSTADRQRLDLHFTSIRDMEVSMTAQLGPMDVTNLQAINGKHLENDRMEAVTRMQIDLIAFALASDLARTSTLQVGSGNDATQYTIDGVRTPNYHQISHRIYSDGETGPAIANAVTLHHKIDRIHARHFKYLLDKLSAYTLPQGGTLLDSCVAVWFNSLSDGPPHGQTNVPYIIGGSGGGFFKQGQYVSLPLTTNNKLFNSILAAVGVRKPGDVLVDDFGDASLAKGLITALHA